MQGGIFMIKVANSSSNSINDIKNIFKGSLLSIIISIILLFIFSAILAYTSVSEKTMPVVVIIITMVSILIGSQIATIKMKKGGLLNGGMVGLIYILFLYLISSIITKNFSVSAYAIIMSIVSIVAGCVGGIVGINRKN